MKLCGIYKITSPTGKIYVGLSRDIEKRFNKYRNIDCKGQHLLRESLCMYGWLSHTFEILETCKYEDLIKRETYYQIQNNVLSDNGLNIVIYHSDKNTVEYRTNWTRQQVNNTRETIKTSKKVKNLLTGDIYHSIKHCSEETGINYDMLKINLRGETKTRKYSHIIYLKDEII